MSRKSEPFRRIIRLARPELWPLAGATIALLGTAALTLTYPQLVRLIVDGVVGGGGAEVVDTLRGATARPVCAHVRSDRGAHVSVHSGRRAHRDQIETASVQCADSPRYCVLRCASDRRAHQSSVRRHHRRSKYRNGERIDVSPLCADDPWCHCDFGVDIVALTLVMLALVLVAVIGALFYGRWVRRLSRKVQDALAAATDVAEETFSVFAPCVHSRAKSRSRPVTDNV